MKKSLKISIIVSVVLVGVLVGADYGLAAAGEYQVSKRVRAQLNLANDPSVTIHGFPFITQAIGGDYTDISINATGVPAKDTLRDLEIDADLHHVRVKLSDLLSGKVSSVPVDEVDGQVKVKASDIGRLLSLPDLTIDPVSLDTIYGVGAQAKQDEQDQAAHDGSTPTMHTTTGAQMSATIDIAGLQTKVTAFGVISLTNGAVQITPKKLQLTNGAVAAQIPENLLQSFLHVFSYSLSPNRLPLPFSVVVTGIDVTNGAIVVRGTSHNVVLGGATLSQ